jgi:hypothetical protein
MMQRTVVVLSLIGALFCAPLAMGVQSCAATSLQKASGCDGCCTAKKCCFTSEDNQPQHPKPIPAKGSSYEFSVAVTQTFSTIIATLPPNGGEMISVRADFAAHSPAPLALICIRLI